MLCERSPPYARLTSGPMACGAQRLPSSFVAEKSISGGNLYWHACPRWTPEPFRGARRHAGRAVVRRDTHRRREEARRSNPNEYDLLKVSGLLRPYLARRASRRCERCRLFRCEVPSGEAGTPIDTTRGAELPRLPATHCAPSCDGLLVPRRPADRRTAVSGGCRPRLGTEGFLESRTHHLDGQPLHRPERIESRRK